MNNLGLVCLVYTHLENMNNLGLVCLVYTHFQIKCLFVV